MGHGIGLYIGRGIYRAAVTLKGGCIPGSPPWDRPWVLKSQTDIKWMSKKDKDIRPGTGQENLTGTGTGIPVFWKMRYNHFVAIPTNCLQLSEFSDAISMLSRPAAYCSGDLSCRARDEGGLSCRARVKYDI